MQQVDRAANGAAGRRAEPGRPWPLGVTALANGVKVAVWAPDATAVFFCLFEGDAEKRIALPMSEGGIWHGFVAGVSAGARYGLRADGPFDPPAGLRFNPHKLLIDPWARLIEAPFRWHPVMTDESTVTAGAVIPDERDSGPMVPKCVVQGGAEGVDPTSNRPRHSFADLVIYEAHLKGITAAHPAVPEELRGTYAGLAHSAMIEHLVSLGVNAIEFMPLQACMDDRHLVERDLTNYWGYQPTAWSAPEPRYARDRTGIGADAELRELVHALHAAGIEVIVDVVFNHTGEGDDAGPTIAHRGLHNAGYYRLTGGNSNGPGELSYVNDTGTGNTVAAEQPMVLRLILDSLRHWVQRYGIDGFRFDLATVRSREPNGFAVEHAFFQALQQDPLLADIKLIAEPWDLGPGGYQLGRFPYPWSEWNDRFRDGARRVWRGDTLGPADLGSLLLGPADHFDHSGRPATASINFITAHDGFTLADVVSYTRKHN